MISSTITTTVMDILGREDTENEVNCLELSATLHAKNLWYMDVSPEKASDRARYKRRNSPQAQIRENRRRSKVMAI